MSKQPKSNGTSNGAQHVQWQQLLNPQQQAPQPNKQQQSPSIAHYPTKYTLPGVINYLTSEFTNLERYKIVTNLEKSEMKYKIIQLQGELNSLKVISDKQKTRIDELTAENAQLKGETQEPVQYLDVVIPDVDLLIIKKSRQQLTKSMKEIVNLLKVPSAKSINYLGLPHSDDPFVTNDLDELLNEEEKSFDVFDFRSKPKTSSYFADEEQPFQGQGQYAQQHTPFAEQAQKEFPGRHETIPDELVSDAETEIIDEDGVEFGEIAAKSPARSPIPLKSSPEGFRVHDVFEGLKKVPVAPRANEGNISPVEFPHKEYVSPKDAVEFPHKEDPPKDLPKDLANDLTKEAEYKLEPTVLEEAEYKLEPTILEEAGETEIKESFSELSEATSDSSDSSVFDSIKKEPFQRIYPTQRIANSDKITFQHQSNKITVTSKPGSKSGIIEVSSNGGVSSSDSFTFKNIDDIKSLVDIIVLPQTLHNEYIAVSSSGNIYFLNLDTDKVLLSSNSRVSEVGAVHLVSLTESHTKFALLMESTNEKYRLVLYLLKRKKATFETKEVGHFNESFLLKGAEAQDEEKVKFRNWKRVEGYGSPPQSPRGGKGKNILYELLFDVGEKVVVIDMASKEVRVST